MAPAMSSSITFGATRFIAPVSSSRRRRRISSTNVRWGPSFTSFGAFDVVWSARNRLCASYNANERRQIPAGPTCPLASLTSLLTATVSTSVSWYCWCCTEDAK